ncbi:MAG: PAS domain-containing protein [Deltaproteobacteria bacterium]|nr:PAS domain-containing protein [Deltaproteobacteria bacterium]MBN2670476.1 PAS domain-containing protein [Deltaproteobacteria bacterium]
MYNQYNAYPTALEDVGDTAQGTATIGGFRWEIAEDHLYCSQRFLQLLDIDRESYLETWQHFVDCIYPEDLLSFEEEISQIITGRNEIEVQFRVATPSGIKPALLVADVFRDDHGDAVLLEGFVRHITTAGIVLPSKVAKLVSDTVHNVNNIFTSVLGSTSMISSMLNEDDTTSEIASYLEEIESETLRAALTLRQLAQSVKRSE